MQPLTINTSRAKEVALMLYEYDDIPLAETYTVNGAPVDLTNYEFEFIFKQNGNQKAQYKILSGELVTPFLSKNVNVLNMQAMFEDIRSKIIFGTPAQVIQVVTDDQGSTYVHIVYNINAEQY